MEIILYMLCSIISFFILIILYGKTQIKLNDIIYALLTILLGPIGLLILTILAGLALTAILCAKYDLNPVIFGKKK